MNRRSIFKCLLGAVAASAMEVCGWEGPKPTLEELWEEEARRLVEEIEKKMFDYRAWKIMDGKLFPTGMGNTLQNLTLKDHNQ